MYLKLHSKTLQNSKQILATLYDNIKQEIQEEGDGKPLQNIT
jgi:hypothetical protein